MRSKMLISTSINTPIDSNPFPVTGWMFGNIQYFSMELRESSHKAIKNNYRWWNKIKASTQILHNMARQHNFTIHDLNHCWIASDGTQHHKDAWHLLGSLTSDKLISTVPQAALYCNIPDLRESIAKYIKQTDRLQLSVDGFQAGGDELLVGLMSYPTSHYSQLWISVPCLQYDKEWEWHFAWCTRNRNWRLSGCPWADWVWVDTGDEGRYGAWSGRIQEQLGCLLKIRNILQGGKSIPGAIVELLAPERSGELRDLHRLIYVRRWTNRSCTCVGIGPGSIMWITHLVPEDAEAKKERWDVNSRIDLNTFNLIGE